MNKNLIAILLALFASFCAVLMSVFLKLAQNDTNVFSVGFLRFLFGLFIISPFILKSKFKIYKTSNLKLHVLRASLNVPMMLIGFSALMYIPLEQIKGISFLSPVIIVILSVFILKEKIYLIRSLSLVIGFIGTLIIIRPGIIEINVGIFMALTSTVIWSFIVIITKFTSRKDSPVTILTYQYSLVTLFSLPIAIIFWETPSSITVIYIFLSALVGTMLHLSMNYAFKFSDLSVIQPISFTGLIFGSFFGYFIFSEIPDGWVWAGSILVFSSALIITYRELHLKKDIAKTSIPLKS